MSWLEFFTAKVNTTRCHCSKCGQSFLVFDDDMPRARMEGMRCARCMPARDPGAPRKLPRPMPELCYDERSMRIKEDRQ